VKFTDTKVTKRIVQRNPEFHKQIEVYFMNAINCQRTLCIQNGTQPQSHDRGTCIEGAKEEIF
jgi:hypothetical protein